MRRNLIRFIGCGLVILGGAGLLLANPVDLVVSSVTCTNTAAISNTVIVIDVTSNQSTSIIANPTTTFIYLNTNVSLTGVASITSHAVQTLVPGGSYSYTNHIVIPGKTVLGTNYFIVWCNRLNQISESNTNNNTNSAVINIIP